jgi:hypothetical protein
MQHPGLRALHSDDIFLTTEFSKPITDGGVTRTAYRATKADLLAHLTWQATLNAKLPAGSDFK